MPTNLIFDFWPWKTAEFFPLTRWIFVTSFIEIRQLNIDISCHTNIVNGRTDNVRPENILPPPLVGDGARSYGGGPGVVAPISNSRPLPCVYGMLAPSVSVGPLTWTVAPFASDGHFGLHKKNQSRCPQTFPRLIIFQKCFCDRDSATYSAGDTSSALQT